MASTTEYHREHKRGQRAMQKGEIDSLVKILTSVDFKARVITSDDFLEIYKNLIETNEQQMILDMCLDLIELIGASKQCLEEHGVYTANVTGSMKVNPAQRELRDNIRSFNQQHEILIKLTTKDKVLDVEQWLNG